MRSDALENAEEGTSNFCGSGRQGVAKKKSVHDGRLKCGATLLTVKILGRYLSVWPPATVRPADRPGSGGLKLTRKEVEKEVKH